jgi:iron(III) transport system permease protein
VIFRKITLPLVRPALFAAILVMLVRGLEAFEVTVLLGSRVPTFIGNIFDVLRDFPPKYGQAGAFAMTLLLLTSIGVFVQARLSKRGRAFQTVTGKGFRPRPLPLGRWRWPFTGMVMLYFVLGVVLPLLVLIYTSLLDFFEQPSLEAFGKMSFENYGEVFSQRAGPRAFRNSLLLGLGAATGVMFLMAIASWIVVRTKIRGRWLIDNLAFTPLVIPGLVMGLALLFVYLRFPLPIYGTIWILLIAYLTRYMPYGMRYATTSMYQISGELEESARTSGAGWWQSFRKVILPLLMPGLIAGWIYIMLVSFRELSSSILLYSPGNEVLAILIFEQFTDGHLNELAAMGMIMVLTLVVLVVVASRLGARIGVREH